MAQVAPFTLPEGLRDLMALDVDQLGRPMGSDEADDMIRAGIPAWHPRNDGGEGDENGEEENGDDDGEDEGDEPETFSREYVEKLRAESAKYRTRATAAEAKVSEYDESQKDEKTKSAEALAAAQERAAYADKLDVALDKAPEGMSVAQVRKLAKRLTGKSREELEADAEELFADFKPAEGEEDEDGKPKRQPRERLRPGAAPSSEPEETDPRKLAELVPRR